METERTSTRGILRGRFEINFAYLALLVLSLPIPLMHHNWIDRTIENMRPVFRNSDGTYSGMLMPTHLFDVRCLGQLSYWPPVILLMLFLFSFRFEVLSRFTILCGLAICLCGFTTLYALTVTMAFGLEHIPHTL